VGIRRRDQTRWLLRGISLEIKAGQITALIGESGAGKTLLARALADLLPPGFSILGGQLFLDGREIPEPSREKRWHGQTVFYTPQNAAASLNPTLKIGRQLRECCRLDGLDLATLLARCRFNDPARVLDSYPFELSGGENQRCLLAMALALDPDVLILDEPFTEMDAALQGELAGLISELQGRSAMSILLICHQPDLVRQLAHAVYLLGHGEIVAAGDSSLRWLGSPHLA